MGRMTTRTVWLDPSRAFSGVPGPDAGLSEQEGGRLEPVEAKWPAWRVTVGVVLFCGAFWTAFGYVLVDLLA